MAKKEQEKKKAGQEEIQNSPEEERTADGNPYLETNIDKLYKLVNKRKSLSFIQAAEEFDVSRDQVVSWARILEDHKLARVHYPVFGTPIIFANKAEDKRIFGDDEDTTKKRPNKKGPKLMIVMIAAAAVLFLGIIMVVNNPTTIGLRSQIISLSTRVFSLFNFLRYPLNIIIPIAIAIAIAWVILSVRRKKRMKEGGKRELAEGEDSEEDDGERGGGEGDSGKKASKDAFKPSPPSDEEEKNTKREEPPKEKPGDKNPRKRPDEIHDKIESIREKLKP